MITSVFARRALLAAAVSATASLPQSQAFFADGPARTASANPAGKPTLRRILRPRLRKRGTPAAVQRRGTGNAVHAFPGPAKCPEHAVTPRSPKNTAPPKQNAFQKFFGKITGRSKSTTPAPASVPSTPPVPPTTREPAPVPPAGHSIADGRRSAAPQTPVRPATRTAPPKPLQLPATIPLDARAAEPSFLQPGAAPAFMNSASAAAARGNRCREIGRRCHSR
jgi:hypothetical protein